MKNVYLKDSTTGTWNVQTLYKLNDIGWTLLRFKKLGGHGNKA